MFCHGPPARAACPAVFPAWRLLSVPFRFPGPAAGSPGAADPSTARILRGRGRPFAPARFARLIARARGKRRAHLSRRQNRGRPACAPARAGGGPRGFRLFRTHPITGFPGPDPGKGKHYRNLMNILSQPFIVRGLRPPVRPCRAPPPFVTPAPEPYRIHTSLRPPSGSLSPSSRVAAPAAYREPVLSLSKGTAACGSERSFDTRPLARSLLRMREKGWAAESAKTRAARPAGQHRQAEMRCVHAVAPEPGSIPDSRCRRSRWRAGRTAEAAGRTGDGPPLSSV